MWRSRAWWSFDRERDKFHALIYVQGRKIDLGRYQNAVDAARAYDRAASKYFSEHAWLNYPVQPRHGGAA